MHCPFGTHNHEDCRVRQIGDDKFYCDRHYSCFFVAVQASPVQEKSHALS